MGTILATKTCVATAAFIRIHFRDNGIIARLLEESNDLPHDSCIGDDEIANRGFADSLDGAPRALVSPIRGGLATCVD